jgi:CRISPR-associated protein Cmr6
VAPFITGLGNEHPLENGFAFLNPYGMPYLAGSGVKGVVRRAAEELASGEWGESEWTQADVWCLFGIDGEEWGDGVPASRADIEFYLSPFSGDSSQTHADYRGQLARIAGTLKAVAYSPEHFHQFRRELHIRGLLSFWDTIPDCGKQLRVEIMTAHHSDYLFGKGSPHDSEQPNPIRFLSVAPGSSFNFIVNCDQSRLTRLWPALADRWQSLLESAFEHAFQWLGFGAKTRVGYGAMTIDVNAMEERDDKLAKLAKAAMTPEQKELESFRDALQKQAGQTYQPGNAFHTARNQLIQKVKNWADAGNREEAVQLLRESMIYSSTDKKKRNALKECIDDLLKPA